MATTIPIRKVVFKSNVKSPSNSDEQHNEEVDKRPRILNRDLCNRCKHGGTLMCCDQCPLSFHENCAEELLDTLKRTYTDLIKPKAAKGTKKKNGADADWLCPRCVESNHMPIPAPARDARLFQLATSDEKRLALGARASLGRVMQHLELTISSDQVFMEAVNLAVSTVMSMKLDDCTFAPLQMITFMKELADIVGEDKLSTALKCAEEGGGIAFGLVTMGCDQDCPNAKCLAHKRFRVLRRCCLYCGTHVLDNRTRLPKDSLDAFQFDQSILSGFDWKVDSFEKERMRVAARGLDYFDQVAKEPKMVEIGMGDVIFLSYKLWGALRGTSLESRSRKCCERLCNGFIKTRSTRFAEDAEMAEILDTAEGLHVICRILFRSDDDVSQPKLDNIKTAKVFADSVRKSIEGKLLEFHLTDMTGFDTTTGEPPFTPINHCSNCGETNSRSKYKGKPECVNCGHFLQTKFDYGSMTDAIVWAFVFGSMNLEIECQNRSRRCSLDIEDVIRHLPVARKYKDLDELGEDFWKLQCYFVTHFIYVMSDWGERDLRRELYLEEFRFITTSLVYALDMADPEIVGEFIHCLCILGYRMNDEATNKQIKGLKETFALALRYLVITERNYGESGMWTMKSSVAYARYHAAWCGVVGLVPHAPLVEEPVAFVGMLGEVIPHFI